MNKVKALIINYNRLTLPRKMAEYIADKACNPVFIDNNSDYPPLLEYYENCPFEVIRMDQNYGHKVIWDHPEILRGLNINSRFIMTDPDLDLSGIPSDFLDILHAGLTLYPQYSKCGFSLEIRDLPNTPEGNFIRKHEKPYWMQPIDGMFFQAAIDTTFALYRWPLGEYGHSAIRTNRPYTAKHVPWYYKNLREQPEDEQYYFKTASDSSSGKKRLQAL